MSSLSLVFVWLDKRLGSLPSNNERIKGKFRELLSPLKQFDKPTACEDFLHQSLKDKRVFFITSGVFADEMLLKKISSMSQVSRLYIYDPDGHAYPLVDPHLRSKMGEERVIQLDERLYEQIVLDLVDFCSKESVRLEKEKKSVEGKEHLHLAMKWLKTIDERDDEHIEQIEQELLSRLK